MYIPGPCNKCLPTQRARHVFVPCFFLSIASFVPGLIKCTRFFEGRIARLQCNSAPVLNGLENGRVGCDHRCDHRSVKTQQERESKHKQRGGCHSYLAKKKKLMGISTTGTCKHMGVSENSVPLHPMVDDHYPY